jgi:hypothetical protein
MSIEDLEDKLDIMPGATLYELWKYYNKVHTILSSDLMEFRISGAQGTLADLQCVESSSSQILRWVDDYIVSVGDAPHLCDPVKIYTALGCHLLDEPRHNRCTCNSIPAWTMPNLLDALASIINASFQKVHIIDAHELFITQILKSLLGRISSISHARTGGCSIQSQFDSISA